MEKTKHMRLALLIAVVLIVVPTIFLLVGWLELQFQPYRLTPLFIGGSVAWLVGLLFILNIARQIPKDD